MNDTRTALSLGLRWFIRPAGPNRSLRVRRILAAACAAFVAMLGSSLWLANVDRVERAEGQLPDPPRGGTALFQVTQSNAPYDGDIWTTVFMGAPRSAAPAPPGVPEFVPVGAAYVSPAVQRAVREDPAARARIPGRIVGVIGEDGLQSPDQYFAYVGATPTSQWRPAAGWGAPGLYVARPAVPRWPLLGLVGILAGIPALLLARSAGHMSALTRQRGLAACHLLGVPVRVLARASVVDAVLCAAAGSCVGALAAAVTVLAIHGTEIAGIAWFAPPTILSPAVVVGSAAVLVVLAALDAGRATRRSLADGVSATQPEPGRLARWAVVPLILGTAGLAGVIVSDKVFHVILPRSWTVFYLFGGSLLAMAGALAAFSVVLRAVSRSLGRAPRWGRPAAFVGVRRLGWRSTSIASSVLGITLVGMTSLLASGIHADLAALSPVGPYGDRYTVQRVDTGDLATALDAPAFARLLQVTQGRKTVNIAECSELSRFVQASDSRYVGLFEEQCHDGQQFRIVARGRPGPDRIVLPGMQRSGLFGIPTVAADPATFQRPAGQAAIIVYPGRDVDATDDYFSAVAAASPEAEATNLSADSYRPMVEPTQRLILFFGAGGLVAAAVLLVTTSLDSLRRTRADSARLIAIGAPSRFAAAVHVTAFGIGAVVALAVGIVIGLLCATVYTIAGGIADGPGGTGVDLAVVAIVVTALAVAGSWFAARLDKPDVLLQEIHQE